MIKNLPAGAGQVGSILEWGKSPGVEYGNPLQYSCLENSMDRGAWRAIGHGVAKKSHITEHTPYTLIIFFSSQLMTVCEN